MKKSDNKTLYLIVGLVVLFLGAGFGIYYYSKDIMEKPKPVVNPSLYHFTVYDRYIPGSKNDITVYEDSVKVITTHFCSTINCIPDVDKPKILTYSKDNMAKLRDYIDKSSLFKDSNNQTEIDLDQLNSRDESIIQSIYLGQYFFELAVEDYQYRIEYQKTDDTSYDIYLKADKSIIVKKSYVNSDYDIDKIDTYALAFSKEKINFIFDYVQNEKLENNSILYKFSFLRKDEADIYDSIVNNDESLLKLENRVALLYVIYYDGIDCPTPRLYLYSDKTYFFSENKYVDDINKYISYDYDFNKIINNLDKYKSGVPLDYYRIESSVDGKIYTTNSSNVELMSFLKSLGVNLVQCASFDVDD